MTPLFTPPLHFKVPGNLLLLGEYAVLEEAGLGICVPAAACVDVTVQDSPALVLTGRMATDTLVWKTSGDAAYFDKALKALACELEHPLHTLPLHITLDSRTFFTKTGKKTGFGSSAAVIAGLVLALQPVLQRPASVLVQAAIAAHRALQDGRGSGYDVMTSFYGKPGLFTGGYNPVWQDISQVLLPAFTLHQGQSSVSSRDAITQFLRTKKTHPQYIARYVAHSNRLIQRILTARTWPKLRTLWQEAAHLSQSLGDLIAVSAHPPEHLSDCHAVVKCLGAGNELTGIFSNPYPLDQGVS